MSKVKVAKNGRPYVVTPKGCRFISDAQARRARSVSGKAKRKPSSKKSAKKRR